MHEAQLCLGRICWDEIKSLNHIKLQSTIWRIRLPKNVDDVETAKNKFIQSNQGWQWTGFDDHVDECWTSFMSPVKRRLSVSRFLFRQNIFRRKEIESEDMEKKY